MSDLPISTSALSGLEYGAGFPWHVGSIWGRLEVPESWCPRSCSQPTMSGCWWGCWKLYLVLPGFLGGDWASVTHCGELLDNVPFIGFLPFTAFHPQSFINPFHRSYANSSLCRASFGGTSWRSAGRGIQAEVGDVGHAAPCRLCKEVCIHSNGQINCWTK